LLGAKCTPYFIYTLLLKWITKNLFCTLVSTKLHASYHLNSTQPDAAMWQSPPFESGQPNANMCHYPCKLICTN